jgi:hypothetical protein
MPMAETPFEQEEVAEATYWTVVLTVLPLAGSETETLAKAWVPELSISRRANFLMRGIPVVEYIGVSTGFCGWITLNIT